MSATFTTKINAIRTGTVGELTNVIKRVDFTLSGTQDGQTFELPRSVEIGDPDPANFIPLTDVSEANVASWVEANHEFMITDTRNHIQMVLNDMVAKAGYTDTPMPWAPPPEESATTEMPANPANPGA